MFTKDELARIPRTVIRIVNYHKERMYGCTERGVLCPQSVQIPDTCEESLNKKRNRQGRIKYSHLCAETLAEHHVHSQSSTLATSANLGERRVAANRNVFLNLSHEGLILLGEILKGKIVLNKPGSAVVNIKDRTKAVVTMLYANDALVFFMQFYMPCYAQTTSWKRTI